MARTTNSGSSYFGRRYGFASNAAGADTPRSLALDPSGKFVFSLNQIGDSVTAFRVDARGALIFTGQFLPLGSPATMVFLP